MQHTLRLPNGKKLTEEVVNLSEIVNTPMVPADITFMCYLDVEAIRILRGSCPAKSFFEKYTAAELAAVLTDEESAAMMEKLCKTDDGGLVVYMGRNHMLTIIPNHDSCLAWIKDTLALLAQKSMQKKSNARRRYKSAKVLADKEIARRAKHAGVREEAWNR